MKRFDQVVVIGYGVVTGAVLSHVFSFAEEYGYGVEYVEHEVHPFNSAKKYAESNNIRYFVIEEKEKVTEYFRNILESSRVLIISASNNYIFPKEIVESTNCTIINFHNALLPNLPGRNAPSWAIYEGYDKTGITWHYVTCNVDEGDIIIQRECPIEDNIKAYELVAKQMELAGDAFIECFENILRGITLPIKQPYIENRRLYKSKEIPGNGIFSLKDNPLDIYRLLRAMDYGKNGIFPYPRTIYKGQDIQIRRYKIISCEDKEDGNNRIYIPFEDKKFLMLRFDVLDPTGQIRGGIDSIEYLETMVNALKKVNRRMYSNMILDEDSLEKLIAKDALHYSYMKDSYLNLWYEERDFSRIMFYIADLDSFRPIDCGDRTVIEIFETKKKIQTDDLINKIIESGYRKYSKYHRWVLANFNNQNMTVCGYSVQEAADKKFYAELENNFNLYEDHIPLEKEFQEYCKDKMIWSVFSNDANELIAGLIVSTSGKIQTEEFIFVSEDYRKKGIAKDIHKRWMNFSSKNGTSQHVAWINDTNIGSIELHASLGYKKQETNKIVLTKGL